MKDVVRRTLRSLWVPFLLLPLVPRGISCAAFVSATSWFFIFLLQVFLKSSLMVSLCELCTEEHMCHSCVPVTSSRAPVSVAHPGAALLTLLRTCPFPVAGCPQLIVSCRRESQMLLIWGCGHVSCDGQEFRLRAILGVELRAPGQYRAVLSSDLVRTGPPLPCTWANAQCFLPF